MMADLSLHPTTTSEQDRHTKEQRWIDATWEISQALIALAVTFVTLGVAALMIQRAGTNSDSAVAILSNAFFLVIGFYFGRTNHKRTGGTGREDEGKA
jgi:steroid 5-alpha reductase family enzyme